jgi:hypothetical protein
MHSTALHSLKRPTVASSVRPVSSLLYPADVGGAILPVGAAGSAHVVSVIGKLVLCKTVLRARQG